MKKQGFTLIELLVTMTIMCIVVVMIGGMAEYTAGRLKSAQLTQVNDALRSALDTIGQKMYNANGVANGLSPKVYGFRYYVSGTPDITANANMLVIVSKELATSAPVCTYFGKTTNNELGMFQNGCATFATLSVLDSHPVTPSKVFVKTFDIVTLKSNIIDPTSFNDIPKVVISLSGYDKSDKTGVAGTAVATIESTFTMDGENVMCLKDTTSPACQ